MAAWMLLALGACAPKSPPTTPSSEPSLVPVLAPKKVNVQRVAGHEVADPFQILEDPGSADPWIAAQQMRARSILSPHSAADLTYEPPADPCHERILNALEQVPLEIVPDGRCRRAAVITEASVQLLDVNLGTRLPDTLAGQDHRAISFTEGGLFFTARDDEDRWHVYLHRLGTSATRDRVVWSPTSPAIPSARMSRDGAWRIIREMLDGSHRILVQRDRPGERPISIVDQVEGLADPLIVKNHLVLATTLGSVRGRLLAVDLRNPGPWRELLPEDRATLVDVVPAGGAFYARYRNAHGAMSLVVADLQGPVAEVPLPPGGVVVEGEWDNPEVRIRFSSLTQPPIALTYSPGTQQLSPELPDSIVTSAAWFTAGADERHPLLIVHQRDADLGGPVPTLLTTGGPPNSEDWFSPTARAWVEAGGAVAVTEGTTSEEVWLAARWLEEEGWTTASQLALVGQGPNALGAAAALVNHPDQFAAALLEDPVVDALTTQEPTPDTVEALLAKSAYHQIREGETYPATLVLTGSPPEIQAVKFVAALQHADAGHGYEARSPILLYAGSSEERPSQRAGALWLMMETAGLPIEQ